MVELKFYSNKLLIRIGKQCLKKSIYLKENPKQYIMDNH